MAKKKKYFLWTLIVINLICLFFAFKHNTWNYGDKWSLSPFHSLWEFFTIWWCVWCSILLFFYVFSELKFNNPKNKLKKNGNGWLGLIMASTCLTSILGFTLALIEKVSSKDSLAKLLQSPASWWIYSFTWHYLVFPLAVVYFFKYDEEVSFSKRKIFYLSIPFPVLYFLANIIRNFCADRKYFRNKPFLRNRIFWFNYLEEGKNGLLLFWIMFSIFYFWTLSYLLLKFKKRLWNFSIVPLKQKIISKNTLLSKKKKKKKRYFKWKK